MRKLVLTLVAIASWAMVSAQTNGIFTDKTNADGSRFIASESVNCRNGMSDRHPMSFSVSRFSLGDRVEWSLNIDFSDVISFRIPEGGGVLIKLSDDSVIELKQTLPIEETTDIVGVYNNMAKIRTYTMHGMYAISEDQLTQIANGNVVKIRVERETDTFDTNYKKNKVGEAVAAGYAAVKTASSGSTDLRSGF